MTIEYYRSSSMNNEYGWIQWYNKWTIVIWFEGQCIKDYKVNNEHYKTLAN